MDPKELVSAVQENDKERVNQLLVCLTPRLIHFLKVHMKASEADAQDCVQDSLIASLNAIRKNRIQKPNQIFSYLLTTCRNHYLKMVSRKR